MGELNVESMHAVLAGEEAHLARLEQDEKDLLSASPEELTEVLATLLGPADLEVLHRSPSSSSKACAPESRSSLDGWFDDEVAFMQPVEFDLAAIRVPVPHWQGEQDKFVPFGHGVALDANPRRRLSALARGRTPHALQRRVPEVHAWLARRFSAA